MATVKIYRADGNLNRMIVTDDAEAMALMRSRDATKGCGAQNGFLCNGNKMDLRQIVEFFDLKRSLARTTDSDPYGLRSPDSGIPVGATVRLRRGRIILNTASTERSRELWSI